MSIVLKVDRPKEVAKVTQNIAWSAKYLPNKAGSKFLLKPKTKEEARACKKVDEILAELGINTLSHEKSDGQYWFCLGGYVRTTKEARSPWSCLDALMIDGLADLSKEDLVLFNTFCRRLYQHLSRS